MGQIFEEKIPSRELPRELRVVPLTANHLDEIVGLAAGLGWKRQDVAYFLCHERAAARGLFALGSEKEELRSVVLALQVPDGVEICFVGTDQRHLRRGLAAFLLSQFACEHAHQNLYLEVGENNKAAIALYQKLGFEKIRIRPKYYRGVEDAIEMTRRIVDPPPSLQ